MTHRSIILGETTTSLSMEPLFWRELDEQAARRGMKWQSYTRRLLEEAAPRENRSAFLKTRLLAALRLEAEACRLEAVWTLTLPGQPDSTIHTRKRLLIAGRSPHCDLILNDPDVSNRHLMLAHDGRQWRAMDLESKNGTWHGKRRFACGPLVPGMTLSLGSSRLTLQSPE